MSREATITAMKSEDKNARDWPSLDDLKPALEFAELGREWAIDAQDVKTFEIWDSLVDALKRALIYGGDNPT